MGTGEKSKALTTLARAHGLLKDRLELESRVPYETLILGAEKLLEAKARGVPVAWEEEAPPAEPAAHDDGGDT